MTALLTGLASLLVFGGVILVHELGHFMAARHCGIIVEEFSIGFGPCLWSTKKNGTTYSIRLLPLGGYNLFSRPPEEDEEGEDATPFTPPPRKTVLFPLAVGGRKFEEATAWQRFFVTLCGALMNFVLGIAVLLVLVLSQGRTGSTTVADFGENSQSAAVLQRGDTILQIDGKPCWTVYTLSGAFDGTEKTHTMKVLRGGEVVSLPAVTVDGSYGAATERAVKVFQQKQSLTADGVVGQTTWNALYAAWLEAQSDLGGTAWPGTALRRGSTGMEVRLVQFWLRLAADNYSGLSHVTVDGSYGPATVRAVTAFQNRFSLAADGVTGRSTWNKLKEVALAVANKIVDYGVAPGQFTATVRQGSSGTAVRAVQFYLRRLAAYYSDVPTVTVDGAFGAATTRAVRAWQERAGLTVDGTVGRLTWQSIYDAVQALETSGPVVRVVGLTSPTRTLRPGDSGPEILQLNRLLRFLNQWIPEINFLAGTEPSGTFDPELEIAVRSAQRYFGLAETGEVTPATWTIFRDAALTLLAVTPAAAGPEPGGEWPASALALGSAGPAVLQVQQWLNLIAAVNQGANFVPETGVFDEATQSALESYQLTAGLQPLGVVGADTWESLRLAAQGICRKCRNEEG